MGLSPEKGPLAISPFSLDDTLALQGREERDSIVRLEEMVETLLTLGEQEATVLNTDLTRENQDLKQILAELQRTEQHLRESSSSFPNVLLSSPHPYSF